MLKLEFMPEATRKNFARLQDEPLMADFTLVGGTALALQVGHRTSEDLDFNVFGQTLPTRKLDQLLAKLKEEGAAIESLISPEKKTAFKINAGLDLDTLVQDYLVDGSKVTFHARKEPDRPAGQIENLKSAQKIKPSPHGFDVMGVPGLFLMKSIVVYDRVRSRDLFDLMVLTKDHGFDLEKVFKAIEANQPARHNDPEHFKSVATGVIPLDKGDEGFSSIRLNVKIQEIFKHFKSLVDEHEIQIALELAKTSRLEAPRGN